MSKISLIKGEERYENVLESLEKIKEDIKVEDKKKIVIKPNLLSPKNQLASTHVDAVRAVLDFLKPFNKKIIIAEGSPKDTYSAFENLGYFKLGDEYNVEFVDLNDDDFEEFKILAKDFSPLKIKIAKTILESDYRISVCVPKTHNEVIATLSLKNMLVGSLINKSDIHQGIKVTNLNLSKLAEIIPPHLSVVDGFRGMEGEGPSNGDPVEMKVALSGSDFLKVDTVACFLMGIDVSKVGYLNYCTKKRKEKLELGDIKGNAPLKEVKKEFKLHSDYKRQLNWKTDEN